MSNVNLFNGVKIIVEDTSEEFHSYDDWGLYITNTDCIGEPKQYKKYVEVPGRNGLLDLSEVVSGRPVYTSREIKIQLAGTRFRTIWDSVISAFRNHINGKVCRFIFDNDAGYYWRGRVAIKDFSSCLNLGTFTIDVPEAEPYKYDTESSSDPWLWDPFNFETDTITYIGAIVVTTTETVTIPRGHMPTCPNIVVSQKTSATFEVVYDSTAYELAVGTNIVPSIIVGGDDSVQLTFNGDATVQIVYRSGSL